VRVTSSLIRIMFIVKGKLMVDEFFKKLKYGSEYIVISYRTN